MTVDSLVTNYAPPSLVADSLTFAYPGQAAVLDGLSFAPKPGALTVLLGANGAGKTTLLRLLAGQLAPSAGRVLLDGRPILSQSRRDIARRLTLMPQSERRDTPLAVRDVVALGRCAHRGWWQPLTDDDEARIDAALAATDLAPLADRPVTTLSGGQWRRVVLARAIAQDAAVLLLDEPTAGLDLKHQYEALARVRDLVASCGLIAVVSLHDLQLAAAFADAAVLLDGGRLLASGTCEEVLTPAAIRQAYDVEVVVATHPTSGRPMVVPAAYPAAKTTGASS